MAENDQTVEGTDQATTDAEARSSASASTGRDTPTQFDPKVEADEAVDDLLTDEEKRAIGLLPDDGNDDDPDPDAGADPDADDPDAATGDTDDDDPDAEPGKAENDDDPDPAPEDAAAQDDADPEEQPSKDAEPDVPPAVDHSQIEKLDADLEQAWSDFQDGEITDEEYREKAAELQKSRDEAVEAIATTKAQRGAWMDRWVDTVKQYQSAAADLFTEAHRATYDGYVKQVTGDTRPEIQSLTMRQKLERAHRLYLNDAVDLGVQVPPLPGKPAAAAKADPKADPKAQKGDKKAPPAKAEPVPTIAKIPAAAQTAAGEGEFDHLKALENDADPEKLERALDAMTDAQRDRYLQSA